MNKHLHIDTLCVQAGYNPGKGEPRQVPIIQSTTFKYETSEQMGRLFDLEESGYFYTRLQNPTNDHAAAQITALEGGVAGMLTCSGQAANFFACFNICQAGDHMISTTSIYGGTYNLIGVTFPKMGIEVTFIDQDASDEEWEKAFKANTKLVFGETLSNPNVRILDIERIAGIAHKHGVPLIVDNTFPTPVNCRPIEWGADIVTHSTTKYMDGQGVQVGGAIVDSGNTALKSGNLCGYGIVGRILKTGIEISFCFKVEKLAHIVACIILKSGALVNGKLTGLALLRLPAFVDALGFDSHTGVSLFI